MYWTTKGKDERWLIELNDMELNYIYFETNSDDAGNKLDEDFVV